MVASPAIGSVVEQLGRACRRESTCPPDVSEVGVLAVAAKRRAQFAWFAHEKLALKHGVKPTTVADVKSLAAALRDATPAQQALYTYIRELDDRHRVSPAAHAAALEAFKGDERPLLDFVFTMGFYAQISLVLDAFEVPLPPGLPLPFPEDDDL